VIRCVSFGFEPITKVQHGPISLKRPASESTKDQANTYRFAGVTDGVADSKRSLSRGSARGPDVTGAQPFIGG
jgi:hypothetical protein